MNSRDIRYLILAITSRCNLNCRYCYMKAGKEGGDMGDTLLERALRLISHNHPCHIQITGGEPTLLPNKIARLAELSRTLPVKPRLAIQTNATLLTKELGELFKEYEFQVGVSLDGPPKIHDRGRGQAAASLRGLKLLESMAVPFRVTTVVSHSNVLSLYKVALLLAGFTNSRGLGLDLLINKGRAANGYQPPAAAELQQGVSRLLDTLMVINRRRPRPLRLRELDLLRGNISGQPFCRAAAAQSLAVTPTGRLYPCGQTMGDPYFAMGTVERPDFNKKPPLTRIKLKSTTCQTCPLRKNCPGECPSRLHYNGENSPLICAMYMALNSGLSRTSRP
ncbi:MAG TPA: radical SAM protein [Desulfobacterales bacterium]|nr:radical SAM protein [Desulfobacterales bacterium]